MEPTRFERLEQLFDETVDLPRAQRDAHLRARCPDDPSLAQEVLRLLDRADEPLTVAGVPAGEADPAADVGRSIGPYRLAGILGEGGFGVVYRATQTEPIRRDVALKILKPGRGSHEVLARFATERQTLARLDHPAIARVIDAGISDDGRPYFVMDLVDGVDIMTFCDERQLDLETRLELFIDVCSAVQHAHQNGIIHRDLKPSNILASDDGETVRCRVIDFGIAKGLTRGDGADVTQPDDIVGTPAYMSPEQAAGGRDVDTRADIHALGVLLFELLTGATPYGSTVDGPRSTYEWRRIVESREPTRPSAWIARRAGAASAAARDRVTDVTSLQRRLRGDLDWIVMRAIEKDRTRRYPTADALAADVRRHLADEPVEAGRPDAVYRVRKFIRRHRVSVGAGALATVGLLAGIVLATTGLVAASRQRDQAVDRLYESLVAQIRQLQVGQEPGRRAKSLELVAEAAEIRPGVELRMEAIGCLTMDDLEQGPQRTIEPAPGARPSMQGLRAEECFAHAGPGGTVVVRSVAHGGILRELDGPDAPPYRLVFSPDGTYLAVKHHEGRAIHFWVWDVDASRPVITLDDVPDMGGVIAFAPDASWVAVGDPSGVVHRYALPDGSALGAIDVRRRPVACAISPIDASLAVAISGEAGVGIFDAETGASQATIVMPEPPVEVAFDRRGKRLAAATALGTITVWDRATHRRLVTLPGHQGRPRRLAFDNTGRWLATHGWDATTRLWDLERGIEASPPFRGQEIVGFQDALFLSDGTTMTEWRRTTSGIVDTIPITGDVGEVPELALAPGGRLGAVGGEGGIRLLDLGTLREIGHFAETTQAFSIDFTRSGELVAATDAGVLAWPVERTGDVVRLGPPRRIADDARTTRSCLTATGDGVVICGPRAAQIVDLDDPVKRRPFGGGGRWGSRPSVTPDGAWLFTGTWRGPPGAVWDLATFTVAREYEGRSVAGAFDPTGRWLVIAQADNYRFVEVGTWRDRMTIDRETGSVLAGPIGFDPAGRIAAVTVGDRASIALVDLNSLDTLAVLRAPRGEHLTRLRFSPDGDRLFATSRATSPLVVWDLRELRGTLSTLGLDWDDPLLSEPSPPPDAPLRAVGPPDNLAVNLRLDHLLSKGFP